MTTVDMNDGPDVEYSNGTKIWMQHGKIHRAGGYAVEHPNGNRFWYNHGKRHRIDGPAIEYSRDVCWYLHGELVSRAEFATRVLDKETALLWKIGGYCWPFDFKL